MEENGVRWTKMDVEEEESFIINSAYHWTVSTNEANQTYIFGGGIW